MLFLVFNLDGERYALDAAQIVEVLALQPTRPVPGAPAWVAGVAERYGEPLPVIDVPRLALGRAARRLLSTRLVVVKYRASEASSETPHLLLGLIVEGATQTRRLAREQFADTGVATPHARWLGPVANDGQGFVQWVEVRHMLTDDVKGLLFPQELPVSHARAQVSTS